MQEHIRRMLEGVYEILKESVPDASINALDHQMEYITVRVEDGKYVLRAPYSKHEPTLLHAFYEKEDLIFPKIQEFLDQHTPPTVVVREDKLESEINDLERNLEVPGTTISRVLGDKGVEWCLAVGKMLEPKKVYQGRTIAECVEKAKVERLRT